MNSPAENPHARPKTAATLYGKKSVRERLLVKPAAVRTVFTGPEFKDAEMLSLIESAKVAHRKVSEKKIRDLQPGRNVQGIVAQVDPFAYSSFEVLLASAVSHGQTLIFLDGVDDPHNVGVILRTCACFGGFGLVIPETGACGINDTAMHVAVGGENYVPVARVPALADALAQAKRAGLRIVGSVADPGSPAIDGHHPAGPVCLVFGAEHRGIQPQIEALLDERIHIRTTGAPLSLNVTVACGIVCAGIARKRP